MSPKVSVDCQCSGIMLTVVVSEDGVNAVSLGYSKEEVMVDTPYRLTTLLWTTATS